MSNNPKGWIGVDLDGTLAHYDKWRGSDHIGDPVPKMLARVKAWLADGKEVKIFTARVSQQALDLNNEKHDDVLRRILDWCTEHVGVALPVTCHKDMAMVQLWDDRCVQIVPNTGERVDGNE